MAIMFGKFSEDMVVQMMSRLPHKSLMRFRCLNKSWNNLIVDAKNSPSLVAKHLSNSKLNASSTTCIIFKRLLQYDRTAPLFSTIINICNDNANNLVHHSVVEDIHVSLPMRVDRTSYVRTCRPLRRHHLSLTSD
ncbi:F-box protein At3g49450-like [Prunus dulcis]|uniref:F-box protein At3g49450-like n=1 Tax=Prunus dulcis TaxID=3755 RepID=UPI0014834D3C|nr:F-box protein At3g49450-like [Prunus dulcis]